jgi:hypothetical protein
MIRKTLICDVCEKRIDEAEADTEEQHAWRGVRFHFGPLWTRFGLPGKQQHVCSPRCARALLADALDKLPPIEHFE